MCNYFKEHLEGRREFNPIKDCLNLIENNKTYLEVVPLYSVPSHKMRDNLTNNLQNHCCVVLKNVL